MAITLSAVSFDIRNRTGGKYEVGMSLGGEDIYARVSHPSDPLNEDEKRQLVTLAYRHALSLKVMKSEGDPVTVAFYTRLGPLAL